MIQNAGDPQVIDLNWLSDRLCGVLRWQLENPDADPLSGPEVPWAGRRVWSIFLELSASRTSSGFGLNPISNVEIESFSRLRREPIRSWEIDMIRTLDTALLKFVSAKAEQGGQEEESLGPPMTPDLFRAVFQGKRPKKHSVRDQSVVL